MDPVTLLGCAAAALTSMSFIPQAWLVIRTRRTGGISLLMYSLFTIGVAMWLIYGISTGAAPIIAANIVTLALASSILFIAAKERWKRRGTLQSRPAGVPLSQTENPDITTI